VGGADATPRHQSVNVAEVRPVGAFHHVRHRVPLQKSFELARGSSASVRPNIVAAFFSKREPETPGHSLA
jgi:hypothetical protein